MVKKKKVVKAEQTKSPGKIPLGVQIISVYYYILAAFYVIIGLFIILGANAIVTLLVEATPELASILTGGLIIGVGILLVGFAVLCFFIGRGLWKLKQWAKIIVIILALMGLVTVVYSMIRGFGWFQIVRFVVDVAIAWYLIFCKEAKGVFK